MLLLNFLYFLLACAILVISGTGLVKTLTKIARFLRLSEFVAAFIIMAAATSLPELFVGISSALAGKPALGLGNVIGANILDLTLVLGIIILTARGIKIRERGLKRDVRWMSFIAILPLVLFMIGNSLSRLDGAILLLVFLAYSYRMLKRQRSNERLKGGIGRYEIVFAIFLFVICLVMLFVSARFVVDYASTLALELSLPPIMIGLFLVSIGTTLPELTFGVRAAILKHGEMALGDQIGTVIYNATFVIGLTALIYPISATFAPFIIASAFLLLVSFLVITFIESGSMLGVKEGISLILIYIFFVMVEFYMESL